MMRESSCSGVPKIVAVIRFAIHIPFAGQFGEALRHWKNVNKWAVLRSPPFNPGFARASRLFHAWGKFALIWNFVVWIPAAIFPAPFSLLFGIVDMAVAVMIAMITNNLTPIVPHSIGACRKGGAENWQRPTEGNMTLSFFSLAAELNATKTTPFKMCKSYVQEWQYGVSITIYTWIACLEIIASARAIRAVFKDPNIGPKTFFKNSALAIPKLIVTGFIILLYIPVLIFRCLPIRFKSRLRYATRYVTKAALWLTGPIVASKDIKLNILQPRKPTRYDVQGPFKSTTLADFLCYDILMLIVEELHFVDVLNLSRTSKSVRQAVLPAEGYDKRLAHFKRYSCFSDSQAQCWVCLSQICSGCTHYRAIKQTPLHFHLNNCNPFCNKCYFEHVQRNRRGIRLSSATCDCEPPSENPSVYRRVWRNLSMKKKNPNYAFRWVNEPVCRECNGLPEVQLMRLRLRRTKSELRDPRRKPKCAKCNCSILGGPKWWVCSIDACAKECTSLCHAPWTKGEKKRIRDEEQGVQ